MKKNLMKKLCGVVLATSMAASLLSGCGSKETASTEEGKDLVTVNLVSPTVLASLDLAWLYAADGLGYFAEEGIQLNLIENSDGSDPKILGSGQADFAGFSPSTGLANADTGVTNIQAVCNIVSSNHFGIAYNKNSGISDWSDINGQNIGFLSDNANVIYNPILQAAGVDTDSVTYTNYGSAEYEALDSGQVSVMGSWLSEYYMCQGMGYDWGYLSGDEVLPQIANSLWVNKEFAAKNPEIVKKFVKAVVKGMYFMYLNPEAVADIILDRYPSIEMSWEGAVGSVNGNMNAIFGMTDAEKEEKISSNSIGKFDMEKVDTTIQNLYEGGAISKVLSSEAYYTNDYVPESIDYDAVKADSEGYEFKSAIYKDAQK